MTFAQQVQYTSSSYDYTGLIIILFLLFCAVLFVVIVAIIIFFFFREPNVPAQTAEYRLERSKWANKFYKEEEAYYHQRVASADEMLDTGKISTYMYDQLIKKAKADLERARKTAFRY